MSALLAEVGKIPAFMRRDLLVLLSYRAAFTSDLLFIAVQAVMFGFVAELVDPAKLPVYDGVQSSYFDFVMIGVVFTAVCALLIQRVATAMRTEQMIGTLEAVLVSPVSPGTVQAGSVAFDLVFIPLRMGALLLAVAVGFGLGYDPSGILPSLAIMAAFVPFLWGLGLLAAAVIVTFRRGEGFMGVLMSLLGLASGAFFPLAIDPARRLAQALGLDHLESSPQRVPLDAAHEADGGQLWAMMLDMQSTFDGVIDRHATSADRARAIKANRIYQTLASTLSGTQEYMAMEKLHELHDAGDWDLLVIDTPPTRSALDFLEAPKRMTSFLEGRLLRLLMQPAMSAGKGYLRFLNAGATTFMKVAGRVTGMELLNDLADFFRNFEGMYEGFKERADQVLDLLQRPSSQFVVVTSPQPPPLREARFFLDRLEQEGLHLAGVVVNRIHPQPDVDASVDDLRHGARRLDDEGGKDEVAVADGLRLLADLAGLAGRERRDVEAALFGRRIGALVEVPLLRTDVHDLDGLTAIADTLTARPPDGPTA